MLSDRKVISEWTDTLDLEYHAKLGLNYIAGNRDYHNGAPYFSIGLLSDPPRMWMKRDGLGILMALVANGALLLNQIYRSKQGEELEQWSKNWMLDTISRGEYHIMGYWFMPFLTWYEQCKDPKLVRYMQKCVSLEGWQKATVSEKGEYAYLPAWKPQTTCPEGERKSAYLEDWANRNGYPIMPLVRLYELTGDESALKFAKYLLNWIIYHTQLIKEDGSFTLLKSEEGYVAPGYDFKGHVESRLWTAAGAIRYGLATNNGTYVEWGKKIVDYVQKISMGTSDTTHAGGFGWYFENVMYQPLSGCETCCIVRMLDCAILLAKGGYPEYWNIVERAARNHLIENQLRDVSWVKWTKKKNDGDDESFDNVAERAKGGWAGWSDPNDWVGKRMQRPEMAQIMNCCVTGAGGLYLIWDNIVTKDNRGVWVNMSINHSSRWVDVNSHRPYQGKVEVAVKETCKLHIRIPDWISRDKVAVHLNGRPHKFKWQSEYVTLEGLTAGQKVVVTYPMRKVENKISLIPEGSLPDNTEPYTLNWKGDTVISIFPEGKHYPLYQRDKYLANEAPIRKVRAF